MSTHRRLADLFMEFVRIDSVTGSEEQFASFLQNWFCSRNIYARTDDYGNMYVRVPGQDPPVFFSAHMDTVEPGRGITPKLRNGYVISDGSTILGGDNKAALAAMCETARQLAEETSSHRTLELIITRSEEIGNYGAINFDYRLLWAKEGFCFDSSNPVGTVISASPFYERFDLVIRGKEAHASRPEEAKNVLPVFQALLSSLTLGRLDEDTLINIGVVESGHVRNTIPGSLTLRGEIRSFLESKLVHHKNGMLRVIERLEKDFKITVDRSFVRENPGYKYGPEEPAMTKLKQRIGDCGLPFVVKESWGVSDANIFNEKGLLCLNMGDGTERSHSVDERISLDQLNALQALMRSLV